MFLPVTQRRNPELLIAAAELHRSGLVRPDTFVLDIDRIVDNARAIARCAADADLSLYVMTKQQGRNPFLARAALEGGIPAAVAVDPQEARVLHLHNVPLGHVGHLVQVPRGDMPMIVGMTPDVMTAFSVEGARLISEAASAQGRCQDVLLRIWEPNDFAYRGQEGGFTVHELPSAADAISILPSIRVAGVTAFPCLLFNYETGRVEATSNFDSLLAGAHVLHDQLGIGISQINAPSVTCAGTIQLLAERGATHGEPGSALTGQTPLHAVSDEPELPAMVYVSEVASVRDNRAYCYGGGFYARSRVAHALVGRDPEHLHLVEVEPLPAESIDYYGTLRLPDGIHPQVGDTVLFAFRSQVFVGRSQVAAVGGVARGCARVLGIGDAVGNVLGGDFLPVGSECAVQVVAEAWGKYLTERESNAVRISSL